MSINEDQWTEIEQCIIGGMGWDAPPRSEWTMHDDGFTMSYKSPAGTFLIRRPDAEVSS